MTSALVRDHLADPGSGWSVGTIGAIAEFVREADEPCRVDGPSAVATDRGAIRIEAPPDAVAVAYRTPVGPDLGWNHAVAFCVPAASTGPVRTELTELGPDRDAVVPDDRDGVLFDLGLGTVAVEACVRVRDPELLTALRELTGRPVFDSGAAGLLVRHGPHRVFRGAMGRVEVFTAIPSPDGRSPEGPHTHLLPRLLARGRTHAATVPVPSGTVPVAHLYPAHPLSDQMGRPRAFDPGPDRDFANLLAEHGVPELVACEVAVVAAVRAGDGPDTVVVPATSPGRATVAVTLRRLAVREPDLPGLARWRPQRDGDRDDRDPHGDRNGE